MRRRGAPIRNCSNASIALCAGVVDMRIGDELRNVAAVRRQLADIHDPVAGDLQHRQSAERRHVLILLADPFLQHVQLDVTSLLGQGLQRDVVAAIVMERVEQSDEIATGRAEPRSRRKIGNRGDFEGLLDPVSLQRLTGELMPKLTDMIDDLGLRIVQPDLATDHRPVHGDVHVLVEAHGEDESAVLAEIGGKIGSAAAECHAKRRAGDDHRWNPAAAASE